MVNWFFFWNKKDCCAKLWLDPSDHKVTNPQSAACCEFTVFPLLSDFLNCLYVLDPLATLCADRAVRGSGHLEPMTSSRYNTKEQEWQAFHYCPAIVPEGEINYKNTTNSKDNSGVLYCVGPFFFLKGLLTSPASPWCNLLPISNPIAFWNWIYLTHSHSEWTLLPVKKKERFCVKLPEESWDFWIRQVPLSVCH